MSAKPQNAEPQSAEPQSAESLRIVSLLPSATEIVAALGLGDKLVARSHACDYPADVERLPVCTRPAFETAGTSAELHERVSALLDSALGVYRLDMAALAAARPSHILTQAQCEVCAVSLEQVQAAVAEFLPGPTEVISLEPARLGEVWADIRRVARALGVDGDVVCKGLAARILQISARASELGGAGRPGVACIEWTEPLMAAGNWVPELVDIAGGQTLFGEVGGPSPRLSWQALRESDPDLIVLMPCGYDLARTLTEARTLAARPDWAALRAVRTGRLYAVDGNAFFNRPGPRLVESLEILAEILHPHHFNFDHHGLGWRRLEDGAPNGTRG